VKADIRVRDGVPSLIIAADTWTEEAALDIYAKMFGLVRMGDHDCSFELKPVQQRRTRDEEIADAIAAVERTALTG